MATGPTDAEVEAFYLKEVLPHDKRSIEEILADSAPKRKCKIYHIKRDVCIEQCITQHFKVEALNQTMAVNLVDDGHVEAYHDKIWFNETTDVGVPIITSEQEQNDE